MCDLIYSWETSVENGKVFLMFLNSFLVLPDEAIKAELYEAKSAMEWQSKRTLGKKLSSAILSDEDTSSSSSEEEEGKEEKDVHTESPKMRGVHGAFASKWFVPRECNFLRKVSQGEMK